MMATYAARTDVPSKRSRQDIEDTLARYGADTFAYASGPSSAMVGFQFKGRQIRFTLPMPDPAAREFTLTPTGQRRSADSRASAYEQATRQRWRALLLLVKAKLEGVESGIVSFEEEFLAHTMLPGGQTVFEYTAPAIEQAYLEGRVKPLLAIE